MERLIRNQMTTILQPFADQVQELEEHLSHVVEKVKKTDADVAGLQKCLDGSLSDTSALRGELEKTNVAVASTKKSLLDCSERDETLQKGLELSNAFAQRL